MIYEHRKQPPLSRALFLRRMAAHFAISVALITASLGMGMVGYKSLEGLSWTDAFLNAAMLLGGMGPVESPQTPGGKWFAGAYALYAGLIFLIAFAIVLAPAFHRIMHKLHWDEGNE